MLIRWLLPQGGPHWDHRSPEAEGIAGSETAVIEITQRLAKRGHDVEVYANTPPGVPDDGPIKWRSIESVFDGTFDFTAPGAYWLCRHPPLVDCFRGGRPDQLLFLRCDDIEYGRIGVSTTALTRSRWEKLNHVLLMSEAQRKHFESIYPHIKGCTKTSTLGCGITSDKFAALPPVERDPFRLMWCSSYDRGIQHAISILHQLRRLNDRFTLHVYYGWNGFDAAIERDPKSHLVALKQEIMAMDHTGIVWHGRVPKRELLEGHQRASFLNYPCSFSEAGVVTVQEAQALGDIVICPPTWGLKDKVKNGVFIEGNPADPMIQKRYVETIMRLVENPNHTGWLRSRARDYALQAFDYEKVIDHHEAIMGCRPPYEVETWGVDTCELAIPDRGSVA